MKTLSWIFLLLASSQLSSQTPLQHATSTEIEPPTPVLQERLDPSPSIYIKTNASDCNIEGTLGSGMKSDDISSPPTILNSVLDCQQLCQRTMSCYSYSWQATKEKGCRCTMYKTWIGRTPGAVDVGNETGVWFSDKHVNDGTVWCYSSTPFMGSGLPGGPIIIT